MATPAADPIKKRYTAGCCALEIALRPSALSQWSERLIAERLTFRLWLADGASTTAEEIQATKRLVAEGDRTVLLAITQYIQAKTRQTLAVLAFSASTSSDTSDPPADQPSDFETDHTCPLEFRYPQALGYLQLCDLNTVLGQCEQAVLALPIAPDEQLSENVVLLEPVRDRRSIQSTNVVRLPRSPRRRLGLWASSAAAALFAVGLTTTLLSRPEPQSATVANNADASSRASELETAQQAGGTVENGALENGPLEENSTLNADGTQSAQTQTGLPSPGLPPSASADQAARPLPRTPNRPTRNPVIQPSRSAPSPSPSAPELPDSSASTAPTASAPASGRSSTSAIAPPPPIPDSSSDSLFADQFESAPEASTAPAENNVTSSARSTAPQSSASQPTESAEPAQTVTQVQNYFQQRWRGGNEAVLLYELKLSAKGEVVGFTAINQAAARESENILPATARPEFSTRPGAGNVTLRILLNGDGTVQVVQTN